MNITEYVQNVGKTMSNEEKPLDRIVDDGGYTAIFRTIACVGDSLASGEFEALDENGVRSYHDYYEYSWGQFMARMTGASVYNFSRGGMTAKQYLDTFASAINAWAPEKAAQAYVIALGVNDINRGFEIGSVDDIDFEDCNNNQPTFAGYYGQIVQRYKEIQPQAKFFFVTMPRSENDSEEKAAHKKAHAQLLRDMTKVFSNSYVIDLNTYAPVYDAAFREKFYLYGHLNPMGYQLTAKMIASYIDYYIRKDPKAFRQVGFIGKPQYSETLDKE